LRFLCKCDTVAQQRRERQNSRRGDQQTGSLTATDVGCFPFHEAVLRLWVQRMLNVGPIITRRCSKDPLCAASMTMRNILGTLRHRTAAAATRQETRATCTRLSEKLGACPMSANSAELMMFTVPGVNCRQ